MRLMNMFVVFVYAGWIVESIRVQFNVIAVECAEVDSFNEIKFIEKPKILPV